MTELAAILKKHGAASAAELPASACRVIQPRRLERLGFFPQTVVIGTLPYFTDACLEPRSVSCYALAGDYHLLLREMSANILADAQDAYPGASFFLCGDTSPYDETDAAARAGLGVIGHHRLLITPDHSSFVFLFELITDLPTDAVPREPASCENCGACVRACPGFLRGDGGCVSEISQKKGELSAEEAQLLRRCGTAWGCDLCQLACPHTKEALRRGTLRTDSEWFHLDILPFPDEALIADPDRFARRAYSWRGAAVIRRNLRILSEARTTPTEPEKVPAEAEETL